MHHQVCWGRLYESKWSFLDFSHWNDCKPYSWMHPGWRKLRRMKWIFNGTFSAFSNKLLSLLNLLCNSTQNSSVTVRDACYGCFFRVGVLPPGASLLNQLSQCANIYLSNTSYAGCATQLSVSAWVSLKCTNFHPLCDKIILICSLPNGSIISIQFHTEITSCVFMMCRLAVANHTR